MEVVLVAVQVAVAEAAGDMTSDRKNVRLLIVFTHSGIVNLVIKR
jgi:hypothetical protein